MIPVRSNSVHSVRSLINNSLTGTNRQRSAQKSGLNVLLKQTFLMNERPAQLNIVCEILLVYNCRVGEVLKATWNDYYNGMYLVLRAEKHSREVIVRDRKILSAISNLKRVDDVYIFKSVNYHTVYSYLKKNYSHLFTQFKTKHNFKVTHGFRYSNVAQLNDVNTAKAVLHHNSKKSCLYYNKKLIEINTPIPANTSKQQSQKKRS